MEATKEDDVRSLETTTHSFSNDTLPILKVSLTLWKSPYRRPLRHLRLYNEFGGRSEKDTLLYLRATILGGWMEGG